jgi:hypothetical protein
VFRGVQVFMLPATESSIRENPGSKYGREQARRTGLKPSDVEREITADRRSR